MHTLQQIAQLIKKSKNVVIFTHMRPDGDAFGSALSLAFALDKLQIPNQVCVESDIPSNLAFLKHLDRVQKTPVGDFDTLIMVDCSDEARLGILTDEFLRAKRKKITTINVDHHISNTLFADYNYVRECSANCMNMAKLIDELGVELDKTMAEYLYTGLLTDSGNYAHDDVTEETFALASRLTACGVDPRYYNYMLFKRQSPQRAKLHALTMSGLRYRLGGRMAYIVITRENMELCGADIGATEGFVDFPLNVDGVEVAVSIMEMKFRQYKISLRSKTYADVNKIAGVYGGGGHIRASGCMLFGDLEEILDRLTYTVSQYLEN